MLKNRDVEVIEGRFHSFQSELHIKDSLLAAALSRYPNTDWVLWLDADELLLESKENVELLLNETEILGFDGVALPLVNLWRSEQEFRTDSGFNELRKVHFWKNNNRLKFETKPGLHHLMHPTGMQSIRQLDSLRILHFGFSSDQNILRKFEVYQNSGQRGRNLWRLVDESFLKLKPIEIYEDSLGERFPQYLKNSNLNNLRETKKLSLLEGLHFGSTHQPPTTPFVSILSTVVSRVWDIESQYRELLTLQDELGSSEIEILLIHTQGEETLRYLEQNRIPHSLSEPSKTVLNSKFKDSVDRHFISNSGATGKYIFLTEPYSIYSFGFMVNLITSIKQFSETKCLTFVISTRFAPFVHLRFSRVARLVRSRKLTFLRHILLKVNLIIDSHYPILVQQKGVSDSKAPHVQSLVDPSENNRFGRLDSSYFFDPKFASVNIYSTSPDNWRIKLMRNRIRSGVSWENQSQIFDSQVLNTLHVGDKRFSRLHVSTSFTRLKRHQKILFIVNDLDTVKNLRKASLKKISACVTSSAEVLRFVSLEKDVHCYFVSNSQEFSTDESKRILEKIIEDELRQSFKAENRKSLKSRVGQFLPFFLKHRLKSMKNLFRLQQYGRQVNQRR